jgi:hypothetical protein
MAEMEPSEQDIRMVMEVTELRDPKMIVAALKAKNNNVNSVVTEFFEDSEKVWPLPSGFAFPSVSTNRTRPSSSSKGTISSGTRGSSTRTARVKMAKQGTKRHVSSHDGIIITAFPTHPVQHLLFTLRMTTLSTKESSQTTIFTHRH